MSVSESAESAELADQERELQLGLTTHDKRSEKPEWCRKEYTKRSVRNSEREILSPAAGHYG